MAVKHLIANGLGFAPVGYLITDGLGDLTAAPVGGVDPAPWYAREWWKRLREQRLQQPERLPDKITIAATIELNDMEVSGTAAFVHPEQANEELETLLGVLL